MCSRSLADKRLGLLILYQNEQFYENIVNLVNFCLVECHLFSATNSMFCVHAVGFDSGKESDLMVFAFLSVVLA